jgi:peptidoglycan/xylan/chitin deacetylase (PgdA/CDA1 family)
VYLSTGLIADHARRMSVPQQGHYPDETFLSWQDVDCLRKHRWIIGSHGVEHLDLTAVPSDRVATDLRKSKAMIEQRTGDPCVHFAYTWGRHKEAVRSAVRVAGYRFAAAGLHGAVKHGFDPYAIPRINVQRDYSLTDFTAAVRGDWDFLGGWQRLRSALA